MKFVCTKYYFAEEDYAVKCENGINQPPEEIKHSSHWPLTDQGKEHTFVMPKTPMLGLEEVDPFPVPNTPSKTQERPSIKIPL